MNRLAWVVGTCLLLGLTGCRSMESRVVRNLRADVVGSVLKTNPVSEVKSEHVFKIRVDWENDALWPFNQKGFDALIGPDDSASPQAEWKYVSETPAIWIGRGWVFIRRDWPLAKSDRVSATAYGTSLVLQRDPDANIDRVFFLSGERVTITNEVWDDPDHKERELTAAAGDLNYYYELLPDKKFGKKKRIDDSAEMKYLINDVIKKAANKTGTSFP